MKKATDIKSPKPVNLNKDRIVLSNTDGDYRFLYKEIVRIEACNSQVSIYVLANKESERKFVFTITMEEIEEMLGHPCFMRVHNSWIANFYNARSRLNGDNHSLKMIDGETVPVARNKRQAVKAAFIEFHTNHPQI